MADFYAKYPVTGGGGSGGVDSLNGLTGDLTLAAGTNITITPSGGDTLTISATSGSAATSIGALDSQAANANGLALVSNVLSAQSADVTHPGLVNITAQSFAGAKTFTAAPTFSSLTTGVLHSGVAGLVSSSLIVNADVSASAAITRSKLATATANTIAFNDSSGDLSSNSLLSWINSTIRMGVGIAAPQAQFQFKAQTAGDAFWLSGSSANAAADFKLTPDSNDYLYAKRGVEGNYIFVVDNLGQWGFGADPTTTAAVTFNGYSSRPNNVNAVFKAFSGQTVHLSDWRDFGGTVLSFVDVNGKGSFSNIADTGLSTGIVHSDSSGNFTSSTIVNADVSAAAAIDITKLSVGTANQIPSTNAGATANEFRTLASGTSGSDFGVAFGSGTITLNLPTASASNRGALSTTDWSTFNGKQSALTFGSISTSTTGVTVGSGSNSTVGPNVTVNVQNATTAQPGLLTASDWNTFNGKLGTSLTSANIFVGNVSNVATGVAVSGDISMTNGGVTAYSGTVGVTKGGTGQTSYTDGQLLIGNTSGNTLGKATITAGTGISVTNGASSITITNTASTPRSYMTYDTGNGHGGSTSGETKVRNFSTSRQSAGSNITYTARTTTAGDKWTVNADGIYAITYHDENTGGGTTIGITINSSATSTNISTPLTYAQGLRAVATAVSTNAICVHWTGFLSSGDVIRAQDDGASNTSNSFTMITITQVSG